MLVLGLGTTAPSAPAQVSRLLSVDSAGGPANKHSSKCHLSANGRYVAFISLATNLVPGDTNGCSDVFVHDLVTRQVTRVSVSSAGLQGDGDSSQPTISADGRRVAFTSMSTNLVAGDTNGVHDIFVHDRQTAQTIRVSVDSFGNQGDLESRRPCISADGLSVSFRSEATQLVPGDQNSTKDVFVHHLGNGTTVRASVDSAGIEGNGASVQASLSADGSLVAFASVATNLVVGDTNGSQDVFVRDLLAGTTVRVSLDSAGLPVVGTSERPTLSADGTAVVFASDAAGLVPGDTNGVSDIFHKDLSTGAVTRVSVHSNGAEASAASYLTPSRYSLSASGRKVVFESAANNLVPGDTNQANDIFVHDLDTAKTVRVSVSSSGAEGNGESGETGLALSISADGRVVVFSSRATNLVAGDTNGARDVISHGPELTLEAVPGRVGSGDTLRFAGWRGTSGSPYLLFLTDVNGIPAVRHLLTGAFPPQGGFELALVVPSDPNLPGLTLGFSMFAIGPVGGSIEQSNDAHVTFE